MIDEIINHCSNSKDLLHDNELCLTNNGNKCSKWTTKGWELCVQWEYGSSYCILLKDLKSYYPMEVSDYVVYNNIQDYPVFAWWVP